MPFDVSADIKQQRQLYVWHIDTCSAIQIDIFILYSAYKVESVLHPSTQHTHNLYGYWVVAVLQMFDVEQYF